MNTTTTLTPTEDKELISAIVEKDTTALEKLYQNYRTLMKAVVMQVLHDESDVDDVIQEVMLQVWERPASYSPEKGKLVNWLATLARRRAIDRVRQRAAYRRATDRYELACKRIGKAFDDLHTVERDAQRDDIKQILSRHLDALPAGQRQAVSLAFLESKTQREISSMTGIPLGTIKTRIELGVRKLCHSLAACRAQLL